MKYLFILLLSLYCSSNIFASSNYTTRKIDKIEKLYQTQIGVTAIHVETGKFFNYNQDKKFKMGSSVKLPIAIYLLHLVEQGKISLGQMIHLDTSDSALGSGMLRYCLLYTSPSPRD